MNGQENRVQDLVSKIDDWLHLPQIHLSEKTRKELLEKLVTEHLEKEKRTALNRTRAKDFLLIASVITVAVSVLPQILDFFGIGFK